MVETLAGEDFNALDRPAPRLIRLGDLMGEWEAEAAAAHEAFTTKAARGAVTGLPKLDREIGGFLHPGLHILHGQPGCGKTAFALQIAATCGCPALFVTCEMAPLELLRRHTARVTGTFLGKLKTGELPPAEAVALVQRSAAAAPLLSIMDATQTLPTRTQIQRAAQAVKGDHPHALVVVDSVHAWSEIAGGMQEYEALNACLSALRSMALALDCPVLAVAERNRMSMKGGGLSAGAGTRKLEYTGWTVFDLELDEKAEEDAAGETPITLKMPKNRSNSPGRKVRLLFHGAKQSFREDGFQ